LGTALGREDCRTAHLAGPCFGWANYNSPPNNIADPRGPTYGRFPSRACNHRTPKLHYARRRRNTSHFFGDSPTALRRMCFCHQTVRVTCRSYPLVWALFCWRVRWQQRARARRWLASPSSPIPVSTQAQQTADDMNVFEINVYCLNKTIKKIMPHTCISARLDLP
jgi:hypothetical protein